MRAYHRLDPLMDERKSHYTPAQLGAFLKVQLVAGRQAKRGRFRSLPALRGALPAAYARLVDFLIAEGDLTVAPSGEVYVDGWDQWQEGDLTVADRMAALRNRKRNATVTGPVTRPVTDPSPPAIRSSVGFSVGVDEGASAPSGAREPTDPADVYWSLAGRYPVGKPLAWIDDLSGRFGQEATTKALVKAHMADRNVATLLGRTADILAAEARALDRAERADEEKRLRQKRAMPKPLTGPDAEFRAMLEARYAELGVTREGAA